MRRYRLRILWISLTCVCTGGSDFTKHLTGEMIDKFSWLQKSFCVYGNDSTFMILSVIDRFGFSNLEFAGVGGRVQTAGAQVHVGQFELSTSEVEGCVQGSAAKGKGVFVRLNFVLTFRLFLEGKIQSDS